MLQIKPTRMELLKLRRQLKTAEHGYSILKEKRDGLIKKFMEIIKKARNLRKELEEKLSDTFKNFFFSTASFSEKEILQIFYQTRCKIEILVQKENIMSVWIPKFKTEITPLSDGQEKDFRCYSPFSTPVFLDNIIQKFSESLELMVRLSEIEHSSRLLSFEIEKTRRRVNALEYVIIPRFRQTVKYIESKLDEQERTDKIIKMKVKAMIEA